MCFLGVYEFGGHKISPNLVAFLIITVEISSFRLLIQLVHVNFGHDLLNSTLLYCNILILRRIEKFTSLQASCVIQPLQRPQKCPKKRPFCTNFFTARTVSCKHFLVRSSNPSTNTPTRVFQNKILGRSTRKNSLSCLFAHSIGVSSVKTRSSLKKESHLRGSLSLKTEETADFHSNILLVINTATSKSEPFVPLWMRMTEFLQRLLGHRIRCFLQDGVNLSILSAGSKEKVRKSTRMTMKREK